MSALREGEGSTIGGLTRNGMERRKVGNEKYAVQQRLNGQVCRGIMVETLPVCKLFYDYFCLKLIVDNY